MAKIVSFETLLNKITEYDEDASYTLQKYQAMLDLDKVETYECRYGDMLASVQWNKYACFMRIWHIFGETNTILVKTIRVKPGVELK